MLSSLPAMPFIATTTRRSSRVRGIGSSRVNSRCAIASACASTALSGRSTMRNVQIISKIENARVPIDHQKV